MAAALPLLEVCRLQKSYSVPVLVDFDFELRSGEVHALVGSNGAGKSTFARVLAGLTPPDGGLMRFKGQPYAPRSRKDAEKAGVVLVLQELNLIPTLTVAENIFLHRLPRRAGFVRFSELNVRAHQVLARVGLEGLDPNVPAGELGVGQQQLVEIASALSHDCHLLVLDEPTAALTDPEIETLFANIRRLQQEGVGIIYVSHRMDEIRRIADRTTVMRDGRCVSTHDARSVTAAELVRAMAGHDLPARKSGERRVGKVALKVRNLVSGKRVRDVSFEAHAGEILGIAGLIGSGRTETLRAIFGADRKTGGEIEVDGKVVQIGKPTDAVRAGIGLVPEDRKRDGLLMPQCVRVNTTLSTIQRHARLWGWLPSGGEGAATDLLCRRLDVRCATIEQPVSELSGGNQQKVVMARWLARDCRVLLLDEPTRGVDVAAKDAIYEVVRELAAGGKALVVVSSDLVELMALCDRILVMSLGRIVAEFLAGNWSQEKITQAAFSGYLNASVDSGC